MATVQCPSCKSHVNPRLWHYRPAFGSLRYMKTQHICSICGTTMYESGGELRPGMVVFLLICALPVLQIAGMFASSKGGLISLLVSSPLFWSLVAIATLFLAIRWTTKRTSKPTAAAGNENGDVATPQTIGLDAMPKDLSNAKRERQENNVPDSIEALERLAALKERGMLTDEEFELQKKKIL